MAQAVLPGENGTGIPIMDEQHKVLVDLVGGLEGLVRQKSAATEVDNTLSELIRQIRIHFETDERLMAEYDYPDRRSTTRAVNVRLFEDVTKLGADYRSGIRHVDGQAVLFLRHWLDRHIAEDRKLGTFLRSARATVNVVNQIILSAHAAGASDIHIDAYAPPLNSRVRFRKDGVLFDHMEVPADTYVGLLSRIKIMSNLDISERRKPQDGKIDFSKFGPAKIEVRVVTVPTTNGRENVVMRLLSTARLMSIDELGFGPDVLARLKEIAKRPHGLLLVCGPTGSGKTTTLHSILSYINTPERKIWTAEDPIEVTQPGLCQVQVHPKIGWTFASAMRSLLRADPDVIMVGEMRDAETSKIAIEASLTGHLVLSTLHTNSAPESVVRLLDLGMDRFNFADALLGILAQRLAKRLCDECKKAYAAEAGEMNILAEEYCAGTPLAPEAVLEQWRASFADKAGKFTLSGAVGCAQCHHTGYSGRIALHELLSGSERIRRLIQTGSIVDELRKAGIEEGMHTLKQNGIEKVLEGKTIMQHVRAVCA